MLVSIGATYRSAAQCMWFSAEPSQPLISNSVHIQQKPTPTPPISIPRQIATPTPTPTPTPVQTTPTPTPPSNIPGTGTGAAPYGPPPALTAEEVQLTQQLFGLINQDRAARVL